MSKNLDKTKFGYAVELDKTVVHSESSSEPYGDWSESCENSFVSISKNPKYPDVVSDHDFKHGEKCFVVWAEYSYGDSFGHSNRGSTEVIGVFKNKEVAEELKKALLNFDSDKPGKNSEDRYKFDYTTSDGQKFHYGFVPWSGYFESLDEIHIEETSMIGDC